MTLPSLLINPERHRLLPPSFAGELGRTLLIAPHPDDESLAGGGLLALLAEARQSAHVIVLTDGARSHPHSQSHPAARLAALREAETRAALAALVLPAASAQFLRFPDCGLPANDTPEFRASAAQLRVIIEALFCQTLLVPWRRDPHCDHVATWHLLRAAVAGLSQPPRWLEYPVWAWTQPDGAAAPREVEGAAWRLDISPVVGRKQQAIAQHRSQLGAVIRDDPSGFVLAPEMLAHFARPWELFIEPFDG